MKIKRGFSSLITLLILGAIVVIGLGFYSASDWEDKVFNSESADQSVVPQLTPDKPYLVANGEVFVYVSTDLCAITETQKIEGADASTFEYLGHQYAKDKNKVYFIGDGDLCLPEGGRVTVLSEANSATFKVTPFQSYGSEMYFGVDADSVYYESQLLGGITPISMSVEKCGVVSDEDTVWVPGYKSGQPYKQAYYPDAIAFKQQGSNEWCSPGLEDFYVSIGS